MISLYINTPNGYEQLDQTESIQYTLNKSFENLLNPADYINDYSKTISIPCTPRNNELFGRIYRLDFTLDTINRYVIPFDPNKKVQFYLSDGSRMLMNGYLKLNKISKQETYEVTLYGKLGETLDTLMHLTFNENAADPNCIIANPLSPNFKINRHTVSDSWDNVEPQLNLDGCSDVDIIGFAPHEHGYNDNFENDTITTGSTFKKLSEEYGHDIEEVTERQMGQFRSYHQKPYIYVNKLWQIFQQESQDRCDYRLSLDPSWFNNNNPYYSKLVYMLPDIDTASSGNGLFIAGHADYTRGYPSDGNTAGINSIIWGTPNFSNTHPTYYDGVFHIIPGRDVRITTDYKQTICAADKGLLLACKLSDDNAMVSTLRCVGVASGSVLAEYKILFKSQSSSISGTGYNKVVSLGEIADSGFGARFYSSFQVMMKIDQSIAEDFTIQVENHWLNTSNPFRGRMVASAGIWFNFFWEGSNWSKVDLNNCKMNMSEYTRSGAPLSMSKLFPTEVQPFQVLIDYCKMFGLMMKVDDLNRCITVCTRNTYFKDYTIEDWTNKMDKSNTFDIKPVSFESSYINLGYESSNDENAQNYKNKYGVEYGALRKRTAYDFDDSTKDIIKGTKPPVCISRKMTSVQNLVRNQNFNVEPTEVYISNINNDKSANVWGNFYFRNGLQSIDPQLNPTDPYVYITDDDEIQTAVDRYCYTLNAAYSIAKDEIPLLTTTDTLYNIHYTCPQEQYSRYIFEDDEFSIYNQCLKDFITERYLSNNKAITAYFQISNSDYMRFQHDHFVIIDGVLFMVNRIIDFDPNSDSLTKCELVQISNIDAYMSGLDFSYLIVSPKIILAPAQTNLYHIDIESNRIWNMISQNDWIHVEGSNIIVDANQNLFRRTGSVTISNTVESTFVSVIQAGMQHHIYVNPNSLTFMAAGGTQRISVDSSSAISSVTSPSWIVVNPVISSYGDPLQYNVVAASNSTRLARTGVITITNITGQSVDIAVSQQGNGLVVGGGDIVVGDNTFTLGTNRIIESVGNPSGVYYSEDQDIISASLSVNKTNLITSGGLVRLSVVDEDVRSYVDIAGGAMIPVALSDGEVVIVNINKPEGDPSRQYIEVS